MDQSRPSHWTLLNTPQVILKNSMVVPIAVPGPHWSGFPSQEMKYLVFPICDRIRKEGRKTQTRCWPQHPHSGSLTLSACSQFSQTRETRFSTDTPALPSPGPGRLMGLTGLPRSQCLSSRPIQTHCFWPKTPPKLTELGMFLTKLKLQGEN